MTRYKAFAIHLCISLAVIGTIVAAVFLVWYPRGLWRIAGLDHLFLVMLGIDIVAGPLLTLIVYNGAKPKLKRDLWIIALAQLAFLSYGLHTTRQSRPVFVVGSGNAFDVVYASEVREEDLAKAARPEWGHLSWTGPVLVGAKLPADPKLRAAVMENLMTSGVSFVNQPRYFVAYRVVAPELLRASQPTEGSAIPDRTLERTGRPRARVRWLTVGSSRGAGAMLMDATTGEPIYTTGENPLR